MAIFTFKRYEKKFLLTKTQYNNILPKLLAHGMEYDEHCPDGKTYFIYNLYYDDETFSVIRNSTKQPNPTFKEKLRLRSYTVPNDNDKVFLELKRKVKGIVLKRRIRLPYSEALAFTRDMTRPHTDGYTQELICDELEYYLSHHPVSAKVYLSYERIALFDKNDRDFRVTFDKNVLTRRYDLDLAKGSYGEKLLHDDELIMEVKIAASVPKWLCDILAEEKIYMSGFTKYGNEYRRSKGFEFTHISDRKITNIKKEGNE